MATILNAYVAAPAATAFPFPPVAGAYVGHWNSVNGAVQQFDLEILPATALNMTSAELFALKQISSAIAADDFTAVHGTEVFTASSHGLDTGDGPVQLTNVGGALPAGLSLATDYWIIKIDGDMFYLATSLANAIAGTKVFITGNGTGTHTMTGASALRSRWLSMGLLGPARDGAITMANDEEYVTRVLHHPSALAYAVYASMGAAVSTTVKVHPVLASI